MQSPRIIISGGGTGGHVFPAIAIANTIREAYPDAKILFVGAEGKMEMHKVPSAGYEIVGLNIAGLQRRLTIKNLALPFKVVGSLIKAKKIVQRFSPHVVVGVGGYASGPLLKAASILGIPTVLQEQNSFPGVTNRLLGRRAKKICVAYGNMDKFFASDKLVLTGNPVRKQAVAVNNEKRKLGIQQFGLNEGKKTLLVVGGSLGAKTINDSMLAIFEKLIACEIQVVWQTGKRYIDHVAKAVEGHSEVYASAFLDDMSLAYSVADIVVSRAGAISVSELCLVKKPVILVPSPNVAEDHQTKNAMELVNADAAVLVKDSEALACLGDQVISLVGNAQKCEELSVNIGNFGRPDAAENIKDVIVGLIES